jgi:hypothetical protein
MESEFRTFGHGLRLADRTQTSHFRISIKAIYFLQLTLDVEGLRYWGEAAANTVSVAVVTGSICT